MATVQEQLAEALMALTPREMTLAAADQMAAKVLARQRQISPDTALSDPEPADPHDELLTPKQVSAMTGQRVPVLAARRHRKLPPAWVKDKGHIFYRRSDVEAYVQSGKAVIPEGDELLGSRAASKLLKVTEITLCNWRTSGKDPKFQMVRGKALYLRSDLEEFAKKPRPRDIPVPKRAGVLLPPEERAPLTSTTVTSVAAGKVATWETSLTMLAKILGPANQTLLRVIHEKSPGCIAELADMVDRSAATVGRSLQRLEEFGLVKFVRGSRGKYRPVLTVEKLTIDINLV